MDLIGVKKMVSLCFLEQNNQLLLLKRKFPPNQEKWVAIGGKLKPFETSRQAVKREVLEETGISIHQPKLCGILAETSALNYNWLSFIYHCYIDFNGVLPYCAEGELAWHNCKQIPHLAAPKTLEFLLGYIIKKQPFSLSINYDKDLNMISGIEEFTNETLI